MTPGHVKIVLPCANEGEWLRVTIECLLDRTEYPSFEILISANGDTVTDFSFLEKPACRNRVSVLSTAEFLGVGKSLNVAVQPGDADYYVFLDAHCLVEERDWLAKAVACLREHPEASMVQPEVLAFTYEGEIPPGAPLDPNRVQRLFCDYCIRWAWPYEDPFHVADDQRVKLSELPFEGMAGGGMAIFVRSETFHRLGRLDPEVGGWYREALDYCIGAWLLGRPMLVEPRVRVLHKMKLDRALYPRTFQGLVHGALRTAYKYLSPRRRDLAEILFRQHGLGREVDQALEWIRKGSWLEERARHLRERVHDDDWLFARFDVYEERYAG